MSFKKYCEVSELVDQLADAVPLLESNPYDPPALRVASGAAEFGKTVGGGIANALTSPLRGLWRAGKRVALGRHGLENSDAANELKQSKETMVRALMFMDPTARDQEIEKFKVLLNSLKGKDQDSWARLSNMQKRMYNFRGGTDYKKLVS